MFALTATFILTEWFLLSALPTEALAPVGGIITGMLLLFFSGAMIIWYISALTSWFRVDRTVRRMGRFTLRAARSVERHHRHDSPAAESSFEQPPDAIAVPAPRSGYLTEVDTEGLFDLALRYDVELVIDRGIGRSVVRGEPVGWIAGSKRASGELPPPDRLAEMIEITEARELDRAVGYGLSVLVDIAIMALSPWRERSQHRCAGHRRADLPLPAAGSSPIGFGRSNLTQKGSSESRCRSATLGDYIEITKRGLKLRETFRAPELEKGDPNDRKRQYRKENSQYSQTDTQEVFCGGKDSHRTRRIAG